MTTTPTPYVPPTGDEPLDAVEWAIVRGLAAIFVKQIREELAAERDHDRQDHRLDAGSGHDGG